MVNSSPILNENCLKTSVFFQQTVIPIFFSFRVMSTRAVPFSASLRQKGSNSALNEIEMTQKSTIVDIHTAESSIKKTVEIKIVCFDISRFSSTVQFFLLTAAVFVFYLIYAYMQV